MSGRGWHLPTWKAPWIGDHRDGSWTLQKSSAATGGPGAGAGSASTVAWLPGFQEPKERERHARLLIGEL